MGGSFQCVFYLIFFFSVTEHGEQFIEVRDSVRPLLSALLRI
jgi:hypothetical protein